MPRVKLLWVQDSYDDGSYGTIVKDIGAEFEEITDEEYNLLRANLHTLSRKNYSLNAHLVVLGEPIEVYITSVKKFIAEVESIKAKEAADRDRAKMKRLEKKAEKDRREYFKLKAQFENEDDGA